MTPQNFSLIEETMFENDSILLDTQSWFIPIEILKIICSIFAILLAIIFLLIIIFDKTCHTVPMLLIANSCLAEFALGINLLVTAIVALRNNLKQIYFFDYFCLLQGCTVYMFLGIQNSSYLLQSIYRYISIIYPTRLFYRSVRFQLFLIILTWICGILYPIPLLLTNQIKYQIDDQMCQMPTELSFITIFNATYVYLIPMGMIMFIYFQMIGYVRKMSKNVTRANQLFHARRELKMIQRIILLVCIILSLGLPYTIFIFMSFFNRAPKYHFRIAYVFADGSLLFIMITLFSITDPLKTSMKKIVNRRPATVNPTAT